MRVKKYAGKVYGAELTAAEKKAMNLEIQRQLAEYDKAHRTEIIASVLWVLHEQQGWGEKRLRRFFDGITEVLDELLNRYEMEESEELWLCTHKLKEAGVDIGKWL